MKKRAEKPNEPESHVIPTGRCPACGHAVDRAMATKPGPRPKPGDVNLCLHCTDVSVYDDNLQLRAPTKSEALLFSIHPEVCEARERIRLAHRMMRLQHPEPGDLN